MRAETIIVRFSLFFFMEVCEDFWELSQISLLVHLYWMWWDDLINELVAFGDVCKVQLPLPHTQSR